MELNLHNPFADYTIEEIELYEERFKKIDQEINKYFELLRTKLELRKAIVSVQLELEYFIWFIDFPLDMELTRNNMIAARVIDILENTFAELENYRPSDIVGAHEYLQRHYHSGKEKYESLFPWDINAFIIYKSVIEYIHHLTKSAPKSESSMPERRSAVKKSTGLGLTEKVLLLNYLGVFENIKGKLNLKEQGVLLSLLLDSGKDNLEEMARCIDNKSHDDKRYDVFKQQTKERLHSILQNRGLSEIISIEKE